MFTERPQRTNQQLIFYSKAPLGGRVFAAFFLTQKNVGAFRLRIPKLVLYQRGKR